MPIWRGTVEITHPSLGGTGTNTWHVRTIDVAGGGANPQLGTISEWLESFYTGLTAITAGGTSTIFNGEWIRVDGAQPDLETAGDFAVGSGTTVAPLPPSNSLVASWGTAVRNRRGRGRTFVGPLGVNTLQDNGSPTEAARDVLVGLGETLIEESDSFGSGAVVIWSTVDQQGRDITSVSVANKFASLRSRRD